jgi:hypothetical protein
MSNDWSEIDVRDHGYQIVHSLTELAGKGIISAHHINYNGPRTIFLLEDVAGQKWFASISDSGTEVDPNPWLWMVIAHSTGIINQDEYNAYHREFKAEREALNLKEARSNYRLYLRRYGVDVLNGLEPNND